MHAAERLDFDALVRRLRLAVQVYLAVIAIACFATVGLLLTAYWLGLPVGRVLGPPPPGVIRPAGRRAAHPPLAPPARTAPARPSAPPSSASAI